MFLVMMLCVCIGFACGVSAERIVQKKKSALIERNNHKNGHKSWILEMMDMDMDDWAKRYEERWGYPPE